MERCQVCEGGVFATCPQNGKNYKDAKPTAVISGRFRSAILAEPPEGWRTIVVGTTQSVKIAKHFIPGYAENPSSFPGTHVAQCKYAWDVKE